MIERFGISFVANGASSGHAEPDDMHEEERFLVAKERGIYRVVDSGSTMTTSRIIERILENRFVIFCSSSFRIQSYF